MSKGLGKGLEGLFEENSSSFDDKKLLFIKIGNIEPNRNQPRKIFEKESLDELSASIAQHGILQPILVRALNNGQYQIISGERRWRAARLAGLKEMPAIIKETDDRLSFEIGLIENLQREDLNMVEQAKGYKALIEEYSLTQEEISQKLGKSRPAIANTMRILALPSEILDMVVNGDLSSGHARALLPLMERIEDEELLIAEAKKIATKNLTVRDVENMSKIVKPLKRKEKSPDIYIKEIETNLSQAWGRKTFIKKDRIKGKTKGTLTFEFYSDDDLENLIEKLKG